MFLSMAKPCGNSSVLHMKHFICILAVIELLATKQKLVEGHFRKAEVNSPYTVLPPTYRPPL